MERLLIEAAEAKDDTDAAQGKCSLWLIDGKRLTGWIEDVLVEDGVVVVQKGGGAALIDNFPLYLRLDAIIGFEYI